MNIRQKLGWSIWRAKRRATWWLQRRWRGWDDRDLWNLDCAIADFIIPRLKAFKQCCGVPYNLESEEWQQHIDNMLAAFEVVSECKVLTPFSLEHQKVESGLNLFHQYYRALWS